MYMCECENLHICVYVCVKHRRGKLMLNLYTYTHKCNM